MSRRLGPGMMRGYDHDAMSNGAGAWFTMLLGFLVLLALIGFTIYWVARATSPRSTAFRGASLSLPGSPSGSLSGSPSGPSPRDVLDLRLASGEITPDEYGATRRLLERSA